MEFAEGSSARPMVSIVLTKECVLTQGNKAYRDEVLSSPPNTIGCENFLSVSFHTEEVFLSVFTRILHCKECDIHFCDFLGFTMPSAFLRVIPRGYISLSTCWFPVSDKKNA